MAYITKYCRNVQHKAPYQNSTKYGAKYGPTNDAKYGTKYDGKCNKIELRIPAT